MKPTRKATPTTRKKAPAKKAGTKPRARKATTADRVEGKTSKTTTARKKAPTRGGARPNSGGKRPGSGRKKGTPNKFTGELKEHLLNALQGAHPEGAVGYLKDVAKKDMKAFCGLIGKVLPKNIVASGDPDNPLLPEKIEIEIVQAQGPGSSAA
jgi:hypothetical protein